MPTVNPRINVTLSPSLDALVGQLAGFERVSKSMVLRELLEAAEPSLRKAVALMAAAQGVTGKARDQLARDMDASIKASEGILDLTLSVVAGHTRDMVSEAEQVRGRRPARIAKRAASQPGGTPPSSVSLLKSPKRRKPAGDPPPSNRGVKS